MAGDLPRRTSPKFSHRFRIVPSLRQLPVAEHGADFSARQEMSQNMWPFRQQQEQENI